MHLRVSADVQQLGILHPAAIVVSNLEYVENSVGVLIGDGERAIATAQMEFHQRLTKPEIRGFRELFAEMGYENLEPAGERLVRTFIERGFKSINALVDAYNIEAIEAMCGLGMHDFTGRKTDCRVARAKGTEVITPIFKNKQKRINLGDLIYTTDSEVLAWLGSRDVDSDTFKITPSTKTILLIALGNRHTSENYNRRILEKCFERIRLFSPDAQIEFIDTIFEE